MDTRRSQNITARHRHRKPTINIESDLRGARCCRPVWRHAAGHLHSGERAARPGQRDGAARADDTADPGRRNGDGQTRELRKEHQRRHADSQPPGYDIPGPGRIEDGPDVI
ncbi:hypothetical protein Apa02nite_023700 [Actinoplanes palleronii]|uniref:Uncharacterized protein n=1 Tax=Actinoplanes palleronii TaxID=113570 RepID=A0ABQ4B6F7_9ACTN|nr:hypothetical protein Apa02nite_023700 [Actinoplanes palleronii]